VEEWRGEEGTKHIRMQGFIVSAAYGTTPLLQKKDP